MGVKAQIRHLKLVITKIEIFHWVFLGTCGHRILD
jgi:hypothetical protein